MKVNTKIHKTYNYLIRAGIFAATYFFLYRQVFYKRNLEEVYDTFQEFIASPVFRQGMALLLVLMLLNWLLETFKWKILISRIEKIGLLKAFRAVLAGVSVSIFMPNRSGEYLGRVFILEKANRVEGALITIIGSISQMIVTIAMGLFGFLAFYYQYLKQSSVLHNYIGAGLILMVPIAVFLLLLIYFNMRAIIPLIHRSLKGKWMKYAHYAEVFSYYSTRVLFKVLVISFVRYAVFSTQYYLFLLLFGISIPFPHAIVLISVIYLVMMLVPSIALTEIGIRGSVSVYIFSLYLQRAGIFPGDHHLGIFAASSMLWLVNIVLPAIAGTFFVFNLKFFRK
jgi:uncharacterized membrane protein YbhN (UPF0104 family)